jgi:glutamine amidotransferase
LRSVQKGFENVGHASTVTADPEVLDRADKIVLPGVGAFGDAIAEIRRRELVAPIREAVDKGKPFLGICLGLQLLFDVGYEGGTHEGLGILPGKVIRFELPGEYKVPHMGWNQLAVRRPVPLLAGLNGDSYCYFVHSFYVVPRDRDVIAAETDYGGPFCSMIWRDNLCATQFHPEKSQRVGLQMLKNFAEI